jgi:hypothetical protein
MWGPVPIQPSAQAVLAQQLDGATFQNPRSNPREHMTSGSSLDHHGRNGVRSEDMGQHQSRRAPSYDCDLRSHNASQ